jgi:hypothetical protein
MTCDRCVWGRWVEGKRTKNWFRVCKRCGTGQRSETPPETEDTSKPLAFDVPQMAGLAMDFTRGIVRSPQKFSVEGAREGVRQERAKAKGK